MSCNGCRVLRKGCSESCILRHCLQSIESPESQGHATVFVAKFFGRAGLMSFISAVPEPHRPALFQSLLFEACGRTVNPVHGAVGLLWTGNWQVCQSAVDTVLRGGALRPLPEFVGGGPTSTPSSDEASETCTEMWRLKEPINATSRFSNSRSKRKRVAEDVKLQPAELDLCLTPTYPIEKFPHSLKQEIRRPETPSMTSEESETTTCFESCVADQYGQRSDADERKLLNLFV